MTFLLAAIVLGPTLILAGQWHAQYSSTLHNYHKLDRRHKLGR